MHSRSVFTSRASLKYLAKLLCSRCGGLVTGVLLFHVRGTRASVLNDIPRFPPHWHGGRLPVVVRCDETLSKPKFLRLTRLGLFAVRRFITNRLLLQPSPNDSGSSVEWAYALDVYINSFFPLFLWLYIAQLFLVSVVLRDNWICLAVGNTIYFAA